ncbi:MAG: class I SAM-dependent methyltransferase [Actinomycetota bacterium]
MSTEDLVAKLARRYTRDAEAYRELWAPELLPLGRRLLDLTDLSEARRVIDIGAGVGALAPYERLAAPRATVVLADRAEGMLRLAQTDIPRVLVDARSLPFPAGTFDAVIMAFVLFHVPEPTDALAEITRILRTGGSLALATWGESRPRAAMAAWIEELDAHGAGEDEPSLAHHERMDTEAKVEALLGFAKLGVERVQTVRSEHPVTVERFVAMRTRIGEASRRLRTLDRSRRAACLERAVARIEGMDPRELVDDTDAILAVARRP